MYEPVFEPAKFTRQDDRIRAVITLMLDDHVERVWAFLTQAEHLVDWLAPGRIEPRVGGAAKLDFGDSGVVVDSQVTAYQPMHVLEYSWSGPGEPLRPVRWELEPLGPVCRLTLTLTAPGGEDVGRSAAGWSAHLEMLAAALAGAPMKFPFEVFKAARDAYRAELCLARAS